MILIVYIYPILSTMKYVVLPCSLGGAWLIGMNTARVRGSIPTGSIHSKNVCTHGVRRFWIKVST